MYVILGATGNTGSVVARGAEAFAANVTDEKALNRAFTGAEAVYAMIPPDLTNENYRGFQSQASEAIAKALEKEGVKHVVTLSSFGADKPDKTGPIAGLHELESKLNRIKGLNVLHLRAGYFMENTLPQIGIIQSFGTMSGPVEAEVPLPMIATRDIGAAAAEALLKLDFKGKQTQASMGVARNMAALVVEMANAINSGHVTTLEQRSEKNTTPTSYETFVREVFLPAYRGQAASA